MHRALGCVHLLRVLSGLCAGLGGCGVSRASADIGRRALCDDVVCVLDSGEKIPRSCIRVPADNVCPVLGCTRLYTLPYLTLPALNIFYTAVAT